MYKVKLNEQVSVVVSGLDVEDFDTLVKTSGADKKVSRAILKILREQFIFAVQSGDFQLMEEV